MNHCGKVPDSGWCLYERGARVLVPAMFFALLVAAPAGAGTVVLIQIEEDLTESDMPSAGLGTQYPAPGPVIRVVSNDGETYHFAQGGTLSFGLAVQSMCSPESLDSKVRVSVGSHTETVAEGWGGSLFAGLVEGKRISVTTPYQAPAMPHSPVAACNNRLAQLESAGVPRWQAMQEGFALQVEAAYTAKLNVSCGKVFVDKKERTALLSGWIQCMPSALAEAPPEPQAPPEPGATGFQQAFGVTAASVLLPQAIKTAACPTQLLAQANITTSGPGTVKYRWVHNNAEGPVASVTFHQGGTAKLETGFTVGASAQGGFAPTPGGSGGGFGMTQQTAQANQVQGNVRVRIVDTPGVQISDAVHYTVTCDDTVGADGMATVQPTQPPPGPQVPPGSRHLAVPAQPVEPAGVRGSQQIARPAQPESPAVPGETSRMGVPIRPGRGGACPFEREAQCQLRGIWQNCCALDSAGRILPPTGDDRRTSLTVPVADTGCVRRCEAVGQEQGEQALSRCYGRCATPGAKLP